MTLKDRGNIKWQGFFMPEHIKMLGGLKMDYYRQHKPILDEYQIEDLENKIHNAMEFATPLKFTVWEDGFDWDYTGMVHRLDPITKLIYLELENENGHIIKIKFEEVVGVEVE